MVMKLERMLNVLMLITSSGGSLHKTSSQKSYYHSLHTSIKRYNELGKFSLTPSTPNPSNRENKKL